LAERTEDNIQLLCYLKKTVLWWLSAVRGARASEHISTFFGKFPKVSIPEKEVQDH
jgi:hypothetical protein